MLANISSIEEFYTLNHGTIDILEFLDSGLDFLPEVWPCKINPSSLKVIKEQNKVVIRVAEKRVRKLGSIYERENWVKCSVWYNNDPFLIIFREGEEFNLKTRFVTDKIVYRRACQFLFNLLIPEPVGDFEEYADKLFIEKINGGLNDEIKIGYLPDEDGFIEAYNATRFSW